MHQKTKFVDFVNIFRGFLDLFFYVVGMRNENELLLMSALSCLVDSINDILKKNLGKGSRKKMAAMDLPPPPQYRVTTFLPSAVKRKNSYWHLLQTGHYFSHFLRVMFFFLTRMVSLYKLFDLDKKNLLDCMHLALLALDEICEDVRIRGKL